MVMMCISLLLFKSLFLFEDDLNFYLIGLFDLLAELDDLTLLTLILLTRFDVGRNKLLSYLIN